MVQKQNVRLFVDVFATLKSIWNSVLLQEKAIPSHTGASIAAVNSVPDGHAGRAELFQFGGWDALAYPHLNDELVFGYEIICRKNLQELRPPNNPRNGQEGQGVVTNEGHDCCDRGRCTSCSTALHDQNCLWKP
jgi:hypothetical protein